MAEQQGISLRSSGSCFVDAYTDITLGF